MAEIVATCLWRVSDALVLALDDRFGAPVDAYVNGSQVWLRDDGPGGAALEWRLHPVAGFTQPAGTSTDELLASVVYSLRTGDSPPAPVAQLWDGLEAFPAYGDEVEPAPLASACTSSLGVAPQAFGVVNHDRIGDAWEKSAGSTSVIDALFAQLDG
jgi:hypothetical protein